MAESGEGVGGGADLRCLEVRGEAEGVKDRGPDEELALGISPYSDNPPMMGKEWWA